MNKKIKKLSEKKCKFCDCTEYALLDCHRIEYGSLGGKYTDWNICVCCSNCHRKIHSGIIKILGKHLCSNGKYLINYIDEHGNEKFV